MVRRSTIALRALAVAGGLVLDALLGEPPSFMHPVGRFGAAMARLERRRWADDRRAGARFAVTGIGAAAVAGVVASRRLGALTALVSATWVASAGRCLLGSAAAVADALDAGDLDAARARLPALVGRSTDGLDDKEIARAVVESVAENLSDAVVASALWGVVGGAAGVLAHRAANTLDAMVGHRSAHYERFGWACARADDVLGWPAARATAALVAAARPSRAPEVWRAVRRDAPQHPSPNAGVAEAAFAAALGLRLGGENRYGERVEVRPALGSGRTPEPADVRAAISLGARVIGLLVALLGALGALGIGRST